MPVSLFSYPHRSATDVVARDLERGDDLAVLVLIHDPVGGVDVVGLESFLSVTVTSLAAVSRASMRGRP
jgi:hypothetical protein